MFPTLFEGTSFHVPTWDVCLLAGAIIAIALAVLNRPKMFPISRIGIFLCGILMGYMGLLGSKVLFSFLHWQAIQEAGYPSFKYMFRRVGYASLGAFAFEVLALVIFTKFRKKRISFLITADYAAPFIIIQMLFVRIGCLSYGCCYGKPSTLPWAVAFKTMPPPIVPSHPTQAYSIIFLAIIFFLMRHFYKKNHVPGAIFFGTFCMYGFFRFFVELLRIDSITIWHWLTLSQITMLSICIVSLLCLLSVLLLRRKNKNIS
ncbi:MAG: prolipoprotein diacylglyceryl transferase family protein [Candidatus Omnitrophota bacterium]